MDHETLQKLHEEYKLLSPQQRNERLQALFSALVEKQGSSGAVDESTIELFTALMKSFNISVKFDELKDDSPEDAF